MANQSTFIKLDRNIERWRWFKNRNTLQVFIWLLLNANIADHDFENETIHRGQVATSLTSISNACSLSIQQVRTSILHLKSTGEITSETNNHYTVFTIVNYNSYQGISTNKTTSKSTDNQQTNNKQITNHQQTNQQQLKNNIKNIKKERIKEKGTASASPSPVRNYYPYPCGLYDKPEWMDEEQWQKVRYLTADDIPGIHRGFYDSVIDYLHDKQKGCLK